MTRKFDIIIIADGVQSKILDYQLKLSGLSKTLIISEGNPAQIIDLQSACYKQPKDHITRYKHSFGEKIAEQYCETASHAFSLWENFCRKSNASVKIGDLVRISLSHAEDVEMDQATELLHNFSIAAELEDSDTYSRMKTANAAMTFSLPAVKSALTQDSNRSTGDSQQVSSVEVGSQGCKISLATGEVVECEFVIAANGHHLTRLFPQAKKIILPQRDQQSNFSIGDNTTSPTYAFTQFNLIEGYQATGATWSCHGARYLQREKQSEYSQKIEEHCIEKWKSSNLMGENWNTTNGTITSETIICDERPVFGPWPGSERLLVSIPSHASEIPLAFLFAKEIASIINNGKVSPISEPYLARRFQL